MGSEGELLAKITSRSCTIGVIGLGYVGLPLCRTFHDSGFSIFGFDVDPRKILNLKEDRCYLPHMEETFHLLAKSERFEAFDEMGRLGDCDVAIICVPTPVGKHLEPDLSYVLSAGESIAKSLHKGQLVVLESTTYPGTTDEDLRRVLDAAGLTLGVDYFLAFSPEREDPGNSQFSMQKIPKLVGGVDKSSLAVAYALYRAGFEEVFPVSSTRVAESAKLVENIYRAVNIALVNELKVIFQKMDVDIWEVLDAAETKPFGFKRFNPGAGWGGHCIPVDPFYLTWRAKAVGLTSHFIERAGEINIQMPRYVVSRSQSAMNRAGKCMWGKKAMLIGVAYKPDIADTRETPAFVIWELLKEEGMIVHYHDVHVPEIVDPGHHSFLRGEKSVPLDESSLQDTDLVIIVTHHKATKLEGLRGFQGCVVDTRNCVPADLGLNVTKA